MRWLAAIGLALALVIASASGAILILYTQPVFTLLDFHPVALDYYAGRVSRIEIEQMVILGQSFGASEIDHLDDVTAALNVLVWIFAASAVPVLAAALAGRRLLRSAANIALAGLAVLGALIVGAYFIFGFETVGVAFHKAVFPQGNWRFPWHTLIIRLYGTEVMIRGTAFVIASGLAGLIAVFVATRFVGRRPLQAEGMDSGGGEVERDQPAPVEPQPQRGADERR